MKNNIQALASAIGAQAWKILPKQFGHLVIVFDRKDGIGAVDAGVNPPHLPVILARTLDNVVNAQLAGAAKIQTVSSMRSLNAIGRKIQVQTQVRVKNRSIDAVFTLKPNVR